MDAFWNFVKLDLFISWPETFTCWMIAFSFFENKPNKLYRRIALLTVSSSVATDLSYQVLPLQWQLLYAFLWNAGMLAIVFRDQSLRRKMSVYCFSYIIVILTDMLLSLGLIYGLGQPASEVGQPLTVLVLYPLLALEWQAAWYIRRRWPNLIQRLAMPILDGPRTDWIPILLIIVMNFCLIGTVEAFYLLHRTLGLGYLIPVLLGVSILLCLLTLGLTIRMLVRTREESARMTQDIYVEEIDRMFTSIRGQRHDFLNHVQVMHTMLQMGKTAELKTYMADLVKESREVSGIFQHHSPALAAFVQAKTAVAVSRGISFTWELSDDWSQLSTIRMIDIIKIVGNLVNNAFDEAERQPPDNRVVHAVLKCHPSHVELIVSNRGSMLKEGDQERIFLPGYTTKDSRHSGLGLSIVQDRVRYYRGTVSVHTSDDNAVVFTVQLPHRKPSASGHAG